MTRSPAAAGRSTLLNSACCSRRGSSAFSRSSSVTGTGACWAAPDGGQRRLGQRLPVPLGNQPLGHLPAHLVGEVELQEVAGDMALPEPRQLRLPPDSPVGLLPRPAAEVLRGLHLEAALAGLEL